MKKINLMMMTLMMCLMTMVSFGQTLDMKDYILTDSTYLETNLNLFEISELIETKYKGLELVKFSDTTWLLLEYLRTDYTTIDVIRNFIFIYATNNLIIYRTYKKFNLNNSELIEKSKNILYTKLTSPNLELLQMKYHISKSAKHQFTSLGTLIGGSIVSSIIMYNGINKNNMVMIRSGYIMLGVTSALSFSFKVSAINHKLKAGKGGLKVFN